MRGRARLASFRPLNSRRQQSAPIQARGNSPSLSQIALAVTGTRWNGRRFFGLRDKTSKEERVVKTGGSKKVRGAIYTRVSTDQGLEQQGRRCTPPR